jgi:hypothetical protein
MLVLSLMLTHIAYAQVVEVLATDPPAGTVLNVGEALHAHIRYTTDKPLRFQARGYYNGIERRQGNRMNPAPVYPSGDGEAIVWIEYIAFAEIDELRINILDNNWQQIAQIIEPMQVTWRASATAELRPRVDWVVSLNAAQQQMVSARAVEATDSDLFWDLLFLLAGWSIPGYFILQFYLYRRWHNGWRKAALLPMWATIPILAYTLFALAQGSNLWPLVMLFTVPLAFLYLVGLIVARRMFA